MRILYILCLLLFIASRISDFIDRTVDPCDNFYQFACGGWIKNNPANISYPRISSLSIISQNTQEQIKGTFNRYLLEVPASTVLHKSKYFNN